LSQYKSSWYYFVLLVVRRFSFVIYEKILGLY